MTAKPSTNQAPAFASGRSAGKATNADPRPPTDPPANASRKVRSGNSNWGHYIVAFGAFVSASLLNLWLQKWIGYQAIALVYLLSVVLLALFVGRGPILLGTALTAAGWSYLFAPPHFSFHIASSYDQMMCVIYFVVGVTIGELTARLRAQREVEVKAKLAVESERLGRALLNSVSHELRTPISAIISAASALRESETLTSTQQQLLTEIESASARLNRVVQSLLSAARLQSGQLRPNLDWCEVRDVVRAALRETHELNRQHPVEIRIDAHLPLVKMDFMLMEQAVANLLANAAVHTPPNTPVKISARIEGPNLLLQVTDQGPGLPPGELERLFDPFHRAKNAKPGGTGLGLAIVKGFVEAQGGRVQAANGSKGGAVFNIFLPATRPPELPEDTAAT